MRALLAVALLVTAFSVVTLAPPAEATSLYCTELKSSACRGELVCVYDPDGDGFLACVADPCYTTMCF